MTIWYITGYSILLYNKHQQGGLYFLRVYSRGFLSFFHWRKKVFYKGWEKKKRLSLSCCFGVCFLWFSYSRINIRYYGYDMNMVSLLKVVAQPLLVKMMTLEKYNGIWCGDVTRKVASFISNQLYWYTLVTTITCYFCCFWSLLCSLWGWSPSTEQIFFALVFLQNYIVLKSKQKVDERCLAGNEAFWHDTVFSRDRQMTIILFRIFSALFLSFFKNKNCPDKNTLWDEHWRGVAKKDT